MFWDLSLHVYSPSLLDCRYWQARSIQGQPSRRKAFPHRFAREEVFHPHPKNSDATDQAFCSYPRAEDFRPHVQGSTHGRQERDIIIGCY